MMPDEQSMQVSDVGVGAVTAELWVSAAAEEVISPVV